MTPLYWFAVLKINCPSHIRGGTQNCLPSPSKKKSLSPIFHALFTQQPQHNHSKAAFHHCHCHPRHPNQGVPEGILPPKEKSKDNVPDLSGQNSEDKTASLPLVCGPANQSRDLDSRARDNSSISVGLGGGIVTGAKPAQEKSRRNVPDLSGQNSEVKAASLPLVQGPANQSRDMDSWARDDSYISVGLGGV